MRIDRKIVEEEVGQPMARQVLGYLRLWREYETRRIDAAGARLIAEVARSRLARPDQPQYAAFDLAKEAHPDVEDLRRELVAVVEAAEHESGLGQANGTAGRSLGCDFTLGIIDLIAIWQVDDHLAVRRLLIGWQNDPIRQYVVDEIHAHCCGIAEVAHLHRRRAVSQNRRSPVLGMAFQVDRDVDVEIEQKLRHFAVAAQRHVVELIERRCQAPAYLAPVVYVPTRDRGDQARSTGRKQPAPPRAGRARAGQPSISPMPVETAAGHRMRPSRWSASNWRGSRASTER